MKDPIDPYAKGRKRGESISIPGSLGRIDRDASLPQDRESRPPSDNGDIPVSSWLRGGGEDATRMPHFDKSGPSGFSKKGK